MGGISSKSGDKTNGSAHSPGRILWSVVISLRFRIYSAYLGCFTPPATPPPYETRPQPHRHLPRPRRQRRAQRRAKTGGCLILRLNANGSIQIEEVRAAPRDIPLGVYHSQDLKFCNVNNRFVLESQLNGTRKCDFKDELTLRCERATDPKAPLRLLLGLLI